jgi:CubicO group peptidase (beta-lactamase class C family)
MPLYSAYAAKRTCSCVFVSNLKSPAVIRDEIKPYDFINLDIDHEKRSVTGSFLGLAKRKAIFRDGLGCTLVVGTTEKKLRKQVEGFDPAYVSRARLPWPDGDAVEKGTLLDTVDKPRLDKAVDRAFSNPDPARPRGTRAVVVVCRGQIVAERYAPGFTRKTRLPGWSMTKSVNHALMGILIKSKKLKMETPITPAPVSEWHVPGDPRAAITFDQLMRMNCGLNFSEGFHDLLSDHAHMLFTQADTGAYAASQPILADPDRLWLNPSCTTNIVSRIMRQSFKGSLPAYFNFPRRALFNKIGMASAIIEPDPSGTFQGAFFMYATARDWARFGLLCLNDGVWDENRILPEGWMKYSTTPTSRSPKGMYGAQFWLNAGRPGDPKHRWMPGVPPDMYSMCGFEGQFVTMIPSKKLVVVRLGMTVPEENWDHEQFIEQVLKSLK